MAGKIYTQQTWIDETLAGDEEYEVVQPGGAAITNVNQLGAVELNLTTAVAVAGTPIDATKLNNLDNGVDDLDTILADVFRTEYTTGGTSTAFTITTQAAVALAADERYRVQFNATAGAAPTLNRDAKGAKPLKYYGAGGGKIACGPNTILINMISDVVYDGVDYVVLNPNTENMKDKSNGFPGLTLFKLNIRNAADTITSFIQSLATVARTYTLVNRNAELGANINNFSVAAQQPAASTRVYINGSSLVFPADKARIGTILRWRISISKTAAGIATWSVDVAIGTNGTTGDTARLTFPIPLGTAVVDSGYILIDVIIRGPLSSACIAAGHIQITKSVAVGAGLFSTGNPTSWNDDQISAGFDITTANLIAGICITPGAGAVYTIETVIAEALNL